MQYTTESTFGPYFLLSLHDKPEMVLFYTFNEKKLIVVQVQQEEVTEVLAIDWEREDKPNIDLTFRLSDTQDLLTICSSLITIEKEAFNSNSDSTQEETKSVRLAHSSVKEYLMSDRIRSSPAAIYALEERTSHSFIAQCCLIYLLQFTGPLNVEIAQAFPLTRYAAKYWTRHLQAIETTERHSLEDMAFVLLRSDQVPYAS